MLREPAHQVLGTLKHKIPAQVGKNYQIGHDKGTGEVIGKKSRRVVSRVSQAWKVRRLLPVSWRPVVSKNSALHCIALILRSDFCV